MISRKNKERLFFWLFRGCAATVIAILTIIIMFVVVNGIDRLDWNFLTQNPMPNETGALVEGGVLSPLIGTLMLMGLVLIIAIPIGVLGAVFLVEYCRNYKWSRYMWMAVNNLAGVPSIVWALLGVGIFVYYLSFGLSLISAGITLSLMILPIIMVSTKEALEGIPRSIYDASIGLGATKWQTIMHHILPYSASGIITGTILALSRAGGETAPLLLTGVALNAAIPLSLFDQFQALPYYIYMMTSASDRANAYPMAYAAALLLIIIVMVMNLVAATLRNRYREKYKW